jgi:hypothetical protein
MKPICVEYLIASAIWPEDVPLVGRPSEIVSQLQHYTSLGIDLFILGFADEPELTGIELFINEVMPYFTKPWINT